MLTLLWNAPTREPAIVPLVNVFASRTMRVLLASALCAPMPAVRLVYASLSSSLLKKLERFTLLLGMPPSMLGVYVTWVVVALIALLWSAPLAMMF